MVLIRHALVCLMVLQTGALRAETARDRWIERGFILDWLVCGPFPNYLPDDPAASRRHENVCWGYARGFLEKQGGEASGS